MTYNLAAALRAIRAECTRQGIDDDARRELMLRLAGVDSSTRLTADGARTILDHLKGKSGAAPRPRDGEWGWVNEQPDAKRRLLWKIRRMCIELGIERGRQVRYAEGVATRQHGVARHLAMMAASELWLVVGALEHNQQHGRGG